MSNYLLYCPRTSGPILTPAQISTLESNAQFAKSVAVLCLVFALLMLACLAVCGPFAVIPMVVFLALAYLAYQIGKAEQDQVDQYLAP